MRYINIEVSIYICSQLLPLKIFTCRCYITVSPAHTLPVAWLKALLLVKASRAVLPGGVLVDDGTIYVLVDGASIVSV